MPDLDLGPIARQIEHLGNQLGTQITSIRSDVSVLDGRQQAVHDDLLQLRREFDEFVHQNARQQRVHIAETRLGTLKSDLDREYGHYEVVRRSSLGTLQAFDVGNVRNRTVLAISEELMIQTPRYWLAPALVALAAWSKDDEDLAAKSVDAAFSRDPKKTCLFFALVLRRQGRLAEATRWLRHYFVSLDPTGLTREFAVLLEAASQDGFGPEGRVMVLERLAEWRELFEEDAEITNRQVDTWRDEVQSLRGTISADLYPELSRWSPDWTAIKDGLERASAHQFVATKYTAVRDAVTPLTGSVADRLDDLLEMLVSEYDTEELPLRREVVFQQAIIDSDGDTERANAKGEMDVAALDESVDALTLQTYTALRPDLFGVSPGTQKISVGVCADDFWTAVAQYSRDYRARWHGDARIELDDSHSEYASRFSFGGWSTKTSVPQDQAESDLAQHWNNVVQHYIDDQRFKVKTVAPHLIIGAVFVVVGLLLMPLGLVIAFAAAIICGVLVMQRRAKAAAAVKQAEASRDAAKFVSINLYRAISAEWIDAKVVYSEEDGKEAAVLKLIEGWPA